MEGVTKERERMKLIVRKDRVVNGQKGKGLITKK